jgi:hypothetical protein
MRISGDDLALVFSHPLRFAQNTTFHGLFYFLFARTRFEIELAAESVEPIEITMRLARGWARAVVAYLAEVVATLSFASR